MKSESWNSDPCGTRYLDDGEDFASHARARYALQPYIPEFAQFASAPGLKVLEIGVGMGADYLDWLKAGAQSREWTFRKSPWKRAADVKQPDTVPICELPTQSEDRSPMKLSMSCIPTA